jgi:hypothetical protein
VKIICIDSNKEVRKRVKEFTERIGGEDTEAVSFDPSEVPQKIGSHPNVDIIFMDESMANFPLLITAIKMLNPKAILFGISSCRNLLGKLKEAGCNYFSGRKCAILDIISSNKLPLQAEYNMA